MHLCMGGATSFKPCILSLPSAAFPSPSLPSHPHLSLHFLALNLVGRWDWSQSHLPLPSLSLPSPFSLPGVPPLNQLRGLGSAISSPVGSGAKPQPTNDLVHIWVKRSSSGGNSFCAFHKNKCNFLRLSGRRQH